MSQINRLLNHCLLLAVIAFILHGTALAETGKITVSWDPIQDADLAGYTVVWGQSSRSYTGAQDAGISTQATLQLEAGKTYYIAVRGFDKERIAGELSDEVSAIAKEPDNVPPVISNISISNVTSSSATISWKTNKEAYVQVEYGRNPSVLGTFTGLTNVPATTHTVTLWNLSSASTYYFRVIAKNLSGNQSSSEILNFRTKEGPSDSDEDPKGPLKFTQITLSSVSSTAVTINWTTDKATTGFIEYGLSTSFIYNGAEPSLRTDHATLLNGLAPSTIYRYRITATDVNGAQGTSGILMFKTSAQISQPAKPSSEAIFIPSIVQNTRSRTNLGINNLSESIAHVNIALVDKEGIVLATKTVQVHPRGLKQINNVAHYLYDDNLGQEIQGNVYLESDQAISAWASEIHNATDDPSLLSSKRSGSSKILIPSSANLSTFSSSLVLMNVGFDIAQVSLKVYGVNGSVLGQTQSPLSIAPNGVLSFENVLQRLGVNNTYGPIEITTLNNVPLIATSRVSSTTGTGGFFEGLRYSEATRNQIIPHVVDNVELRTNIGINNVSDELATVLIRLMSKDGSQLGAVPVTVPAKGLTQINHVVRQLLNTADVSNMEGYIRLESNQPIFGWASQIDNTTSDPGFAVGKGQGATKLLVQSAANIGSFKSSLVVVNTGQADAIVDILARDSEGKVKGELTGVLIPARGYFSSPNILERLGVSNNFGPVEIVSTNGQPLMATSRVYSTSGTSGFFEGQSVD